MFMRTLEVRSLRLPRESSPNGLLLAPALPKASYAHASIPNLRAKMLEYYDLASSLATSRAKMLEYYDLASSLATSPLQWRGLGTLQSTLSRYADAVRG